MSPFNSKSSIFFLPAWACKTFKSQEPLRNRFKEKDADSSSLYFWAIKMDVGKSPCKCVSRNNTWRNITEKVFAGEYL